MASVNRLRAQRRRSRRRLARRGDLLRRRNRLALPAASGTSAAGERGQADCGVGARRVGRRLELGRRSRRAAKQGYDVRAIANPLENLTTDAASVATFLRSLNGPIVLVGHSYGGSVITEAAAGIPKCQSARLRRRRRPRRRRDQRVPVGRGFGAQAEARSRAVRQAARPGAPAGTSDLYLKKDIFLHNFGNDLPADTATPAVGHPAHRVHRRVRHPCNAGGLEDDPVVVLHQHRRPDHHPHFGDSDGEPGTFPGHRFDGGSHLTLISHPDAVTAVIQNAIDSVQ